METLEAILTRRSVRRFIQDKSVPADIVEKLLEAGMNAPSARNEQPWHFVVVDQRELLDKIPTVHPYSKMCLEAPLAIICCMDASTAMDDKFLAQDLGAAVQNIMLAARALGLGSVWLGVYPNEKLMNGLRELFGIPKQIMPFNIIPVGYTDMEQTSQPRYKKDRIHKNQWSVKLGD
ncbi:MAG: nitroreductase family protein [Gammaproteobacteria bacterium]|nr:nitroreductase family protein [Gammaproteobacteria bacterium]